MTSDTAGLSNSDPAWLDAVPRPLLKSMESIGLDERFFRTLRDVPKLSSAAIGFASAEYASPLRFYSASLLTFAVAQMAAALPDLGGADAITTILKNHLSEAWAAYAAGLAVGALWMHVVLAITAVTADWPRIPYREGLRRLLFVFGWGSFYSGLALAAGAAIGSLVSDEGAFVGMLCGSAVASFQFVLVARALNAPGRVHVLAWLGVICSWLFVLALGVVAAMAALGW